MPMWSDVIARARQRLLVNVIVKQGAHALNACLGLLVAAVVLGTDLFHWRWLAIPPVIVLAIGVWYSWRRFPGTYSMAQLVDRRLGLSDVLSTAAFFSAAPSRGCDEGMRRAQAEMATRAAVDVRMSQAVPLRIPRAILYSVLLGGLIAGLLTVRYRFEGRPNFHRPMAPALHLLARLVEKEKAVEPEKKKEPEEEAQEGAKQEGRSKAPDGDPHGKKSDQASAATANSQESQKAQNQGEASRADDSMAEDPTGEGEGQGESGKTGEDKRSNGSEKQQTGSAQQQGNRGDRAQQQNGASGESSSVLSKISNTLSNLMSALKPSSAAGAQQSSKEASGSKSGQKKAAQGREQGQRGEGSEAGADPSANSAKAEGAQGGNGQGADGQNGKQAGSSAGQNEGDKTIQAADQRAAMGKISMILGKRSENVTGSAAIEVLSGEQALNTPYARRKAEHQDVHAKGERDEVPLELQPYVNSYFARLRQSGAPAPRSQKK